MSDQDKERNTLLQLLRCPRTGQPLHGKEDGVFSTNSTTGEDYRSIHGKPVLIDFRESVLDEESLFSRAGESPVERITRERWGWLRRLTKQDKRVTVENTALFIQALKDPHSPLRPRVLVVGGGSVGKGVEALYSDPAIKLLSCDIYASPHVDVIADAHKLPFADGVFDGVVIQAVLEHVVEPHTVVAEIARVLRADGLVYAETPFMQPVHEGAYDFTRFTESGHRYLFKQFKTIRSGACSGAGSYLQWAAEYFIRSLTRSKKLGKVVKVGLFWLPFFDRIIPERFNVDAACGVFFLGSKTKASLTPKGLIAHYRGAQG